MVLPKHGGQPSPFSGPPEAAPGRAGANVRLEGVTHAYRTGRRTVSVLRGVDLDLGAGGYAALTGKSGAGKTTVLSLIGGLEAPTSGDVQVGEQAVGRLGRNALAEFRRNTIGFVFQHFGLLDALTAVENVELALALSGQARETRRGKAMGLLDAVDLADRADHRPASLSGGERQRVAIARAVANEPRVILADEPTGNLDSDASDVVLDLLERQRKERGCTLLVVTHNVAVAARSHQRFRLEGGRLTQL